MIVPSNKWIEKFNISFPLSLKTIIYILQMNKIKVNNYQVKAYQGLKGIINKTYDI